MKKRIFWSIIGVTVVSITIFNIFVTSIMYNNLFSHQENNIKIELENVLQMLNTKSEIQDISNFITSNRITIINKYGDVIFDNYSDYFYMENHIDRPEIIQAIENGHGEDTRLSNTAGKQTSYYAKRLDNGNILRMSFTISTVSAIIYNSVPFIVVCFLFFIAFIMAFSSILTKNIIKPIDPKNPDIYDELLPFVKKISNQKKNIQKQKNVLEQKITELDLISRNIGDGLIVLDSKQNIISVNKKAVKKLGKSNFNYINKPFIDLVRTKLVQDNVEKAYKGEFCETTITINDKFLSFRMSPIFRDNIVKGIIIFIFDNTKKMEIEKIRREFSANVSHELKTPLTSISGYAELMKNGMVQSKDIVPFSQNIYNEARHLIELIEDIIRVSKLDEGESIFEFSNVELQTTIQTILDRLTPLASEKNVTIQTKLYSIQINGVKHILEEIFYNIIENSLKYNKKDGEISVEMEDNKEFIIITVKDTGIGIEENSIKRIFERFYRADTSHSSEISGTGLGLSIVKHGINIHEGKIEVTSKINHGSTFKIFIKNKAYQN